jgi:hypothetical protein
MIIEEQGIHTPDLYIFLCSKPHDNPQQTLPPMASMVSMLRLPPQTTTTHQTLTFSQSTHNAFYIYIPARNAKNLRNKRASYAFRPRRFLIRVLIGVACCNADPGVPKAILVLEVFTGVAAVIISSSIDSSSSDEV